MGQQQGQTGSRVMYMWLDAEGLPRAWGAGMPKDEEAVRERTRRELDAYVAEHGGRVEDFTEKRDEYLEHPHTRDEHCEPHVDPSTGCCKVCGVERAEEPCPHCGQRSFHADDCPTVQAANVPLPSRALLRRLAKDAAELLVEIESRARTSSPRGETWTLLHTPIGILESVRRMIADARKAGLLAKGVDRG